jgi:membrane protein
LARLPQHTPEHRIVSIAAGVTFFVLLSIFPGIAALVAVYGLFADPSSIGQHLNDLSGVLPGGATQVIGDQLTRLTSQPRSQLGFALAFGVAVSLWSANAGMKALFDALNVVYGEKEQRGFIRLNTISLAFTLGALIFMMIAVSAIAVLPLALGYLGLSGGVEWLVALGKWPLLVVTIAFGIALIYRYGPSRKEPQWRWVSWGSALAALLWLATSVLFSWYAGNFGNYDKTYGSLGAAVGLMILATQRRENELASHHEHLTLELAILSEQKTAKIISLPEELRQDHPDIHDRIDDEAAAMSEPATRNRCSKRSKGTCRNPGYR